jgi:hypothetical protein
VFLKVELDLALREFLLILRVLFKEVAGELPGHSDHGESG